MLAQLDYICRVRKDIRTDCWGLSNSSGGLSFLLLNFLTMNDNNFFTVQGWMVNSPRLESYTELIVYAIIYGFSQGQLGIFNGSISYLVECSRTSKRTVQRSLRSLEDKGLIMRTFNEVTDKTPRYSVSDVTHHATQSPPHATVAGEGGATVTPNSIVNNNIDIKEGTPSKFVRPNLIEVRDYFKDRGHKNPAQEAAKFMAHYESNGWKVGRNSMKSWTAAVGGWVLRDSHDTPMIVERTTNLHR